jgi:plastocyanin
MRFGRLVVAVALCPVIGCGGSGGDGSTNPPPPQTVNSVSLSKSIVALKPSESTTITATPKDANGATVSGKTVDWTVNPATGVATIAPNGSSVTVTGTANGSATVRATVDQKIAEAQVNVQSTFNTTADISVGANNAFAFAPSEADVATGATVTFTWVGNTDHTLNWDNPPAPLQNVSARTTGTAVFTLPQPGTYNYHCTIHSGMTGAITVH